MKQKSIGTKPTELDEGTSKSKAAIKAAAPYPRFVMCLENGGNEASLDLGRVYKVIRPKPNDPPQYLRVIDNEGEDYLYFEKQFEPVEVTPKSKRFVGATAYASL